MKLGDYIIDHDCGTHGLLVDYLVSETSFTYGRKAWFILYDDGDMDWSFENSLEVVYET